MFISLKPLQVCPLGHFFKNFVMLPLVLVSSQNIVQGARIAQHYLSDKFSLPHIFSAFEVDGSDDTKKEGQSSLVRAPEFLPGKLLSNCLVLLDSLSLMSSPMPFIQKFSLLNHGFFAL